MINKLRIVIAASLLAVTTHSVAAPSLGNTTTSPYSIRVVATTDTVIIKPQPQPIKAGVQNGRPPLAYIEAVTADRKDAQFAFLPADPLLTSTGNVNVDDGTTINLYTRSSLKNMDGGDELMVLSGFANDPSKTKYTNNGQTWVVSSKVPVARLTVTPYQTFANILPGRYTYSAQLAAYYP